MGDIIQIYIYIYMYYIFFDSHDAKIQVFIIKTIAKMSERVGQKKKLSTGGVWVLLEAGKRGTTRR